MTRSEAVSAIYEVINSGIIDKDLEERLTRACTCICSDDWEDCNVGECDENCENCDFIEDNDEEEPEVEEEFTEDKFETDYTLSVGARPPRKI